MNKFSKKNIDKNDFFAGDDGITIDNLLLLIKGSEYYQNVLNYFQIEENDTTKINIPGSKTLFTILNSSNKKLRKEDIKVELQNIKFDYSSKFGIVFNNIQENEYLKNKNINSLKAYPIHSAEKDFFSNLYDIDKYASKLLNNGFKDILDYFVEGD